MKPHDLQASPRSISFAALTGDAIAVQNGLGDLADPNAIKATVATLTTPVEYTGAGIDGAIGLAAMSPLRGVTVTTSANAGAYALVGITITGTVKINGKTVVVTDVLTLTEVNGNETIYGSIGFETVTAITVPAMADTDGDLEFGVADVFGQHREPFRAVIGLDTGVVKVGYDAGRTDLVPVVAGREFKIEPGRIYAVGTTAIFMLLE